MVFQYTLREVIPSETSWSPQKTMIPYLLSSGMIQRFKGARVDGNEESIGESGRTFGVRFSSIYDYHNTTGHTTTVENSSIMEREEINHAKSIK